MNKARVLLSLALMLSLSACISTSSLDVPTQEPVDVEERAVVDGQPLPLPDEPAIRAESIGKAKPSSPVVNRLMASAQSQRVKGNWDDAASSLERALRIEPRNASVWAALAEVKYGQKDWRSAIQLAAKSNTLSGDDANLRRQNWYLMANAHQALGNLDAAAKFRAKL